jgi:hypothetical protein
MSSMRTGQWRGPGPAMVSRVVVVMIFRAICDGTWELGPAAVGFRMWKEIVFRRFAVNS